MYVARYSDRTVLLPNCKAVGETQAVLHILKVQKWDECIRPFFGDLVVYLLQKYCTASCWNHPTVLVIKKRDLLKMVE